MSQKSFNTLAGTIFLIVGIIHLLRAFNGWPVSVSTFAVPMWASWVGVVVAGSLAYRGLKR